MGAVILVLLLIFLGLFIGSVIFNGFLDFLDFLMNPTGIFVVVVILAIIFVVMHVTG